MAYSANPVMNRSDRIFKRVMLMNGIFSLRKRLSNQLAIHANQVRRFEWHKESQNEGAESATPVTLDTPIQARLF